MRIVLGIEYDGSNYCGWQSQPNRCGVQDVLEAAICAIAQHPIRLHAAGRTDAGVHALMQVVHFDTTANRPENAWLRGVNALLPNAVRVIWSKTVMDDFHARFSAQRRSYQYLLVNHSVAPAILATKAGWYHLPLNLKTMQEAAHYLIGEHDFSAFRASECQANTAVRTIYQASVEQFDEKFIFKFAANAFLQHQVRNMLGALIYVGNGKNPPSFIRDLLLQQDRTISPPTFSANGLYLTGVSYDERWQLPSNERVITVI
ncbi:MAG: tRNA pseudouridine(38-40) synthase TruA [Methylophilaceae bacterium]|jgi:tRNA pseudouridine38-40 synthase|nr:MAG: tRNA pseudouridine(38-40) synthase TruA [Methylophilaceae bacterium]